MERLAKEYSQNVKFYNYSKELVNLFTTRGKSLAISGTPQELVTYIKEILNIDHAFATQFEYEDDVYTGKVIVNMALKENKEKILEQFIEEENISLKGSFGFGDTEEDNGYGVAIDNDQYIYLVGSTKNYGINTPSYSNAFLVKFDVDGNVK